MIVPDYREFKHSNELYHYGIPRRSGRYPWGSGKRPHQSKEEKKRIKAEARDAKNLVIGTERLKNRLDRANKLADVDNLSKKIGWTYTQKAGEAHKNIKDIKQISNEILENDERIKKLGDYTRKARIADIAITSSSIGAVSGLGSVALMSAWGLNPITLGLPIAAGAYIGKTGYDFYKKTKY